MPYVDPTIACGPYLTPDEGGNYPQLCCATPEGGETSIDCDGVSSPVVYQWTDEQIVAAATNMLFRRTCFRYPGLCDRTIIACICQQIVCLCGRYEPTIELTSDYPIHEVTKITIKIEGEPDDVLDPDQYRLDENSRIVRIDGDVWPTDRRSVWIEYVSGREAPIELQLATAELACELKKACSGSSDCQLPSHVRSVTRRGVEMEVKDVMALMMSGLTGNPIIDHVLTTLGNCRHARMFDALHDRRTDIRVTT